MKGSAKEPKVLVLMSSMPLKIKIHENRLNTYAVVPSALDDALRNSHNELPADLPLPVWDSLQKQKQYR